MLRGAESNREPVRNRVMRRQVFRPPVEPSRQLRLLAGFLCYLHLSSQFFVAARMVTMLEESRLPTHLRALLPCRRQPCTRLGCR